MAVPHYFPLKLVRISFYSFSGFSFPLNVESADGSSTFAVWVLQFRDLGLVPLHLFHLRFTSIGLFLPSIWPSSGSESNFKCSSLTPSNAPSAEQYHRPYFLPWVVSVVSVSTI